MVDTVAVRGWTVREVAAHITHSQLPKSKMLLELLRSGFRFNTMVYRAALQDERSPGELTAVLRGMRAHVNGRPAPVRSIP